MPLASSTQRRHEPAVPHVEVEPAAARVLPFAIVLLLVASGAAALVYQVLWVKQLSLVVGVEVYAVTIGVSGFFAGLGLGSFAFGRWADGHAQPLVLYAYLEAGVAVLGIVTTLVLPSTAGLFADIEAVVGGAAWLLPMALIGVPAALMGGTLPVLTRSLLRSSGIGRIGGALYAANTVGAIVGALVTPFVAIPLLGVRGSAYAAAAVNLAAAAAALVLARRFTAPLAGSRAVQPAAAAAASWIALLLYACAGGIALGYEVVWSQAMVPLMSTRSFAFAVMLATYLTGLALGAACNARWADKIRDPWQVFGLLIASAGTVALLEIALLGRWLVVLQTQAEAALLTITGNQLAGMCARFAVAGAYVVFIPTVLLGAAFPIAVRLAVADGHVGRDVGKVLAFNTAGGIAGTMLTGFVLVPLLGLVRSLAVLAAAAALIGIVAAMRTSPATWVRWATCTATAVTAFAALLTPTDRLAKLLPAARAGGLTFYEEGRGGTVAVVQSTSGHNRFKRLYIQGVSNSGDAMPSQRYMRLQALLPLLIHRGEPRAALVIGLGTGITAGALLQYPGLEHRVVIELLPAVVRAAALFDGNFGVATDPRIDIHIGDGRRELLRSPARYDLITLEPPPPSASGVANLYSTDFYALAAARLRPAGLVAQWLPLPTQNDEDTRTLVRSFVDAFPHASLWTTELHEMLLVGSLDPLELDAQRVAARFTEPSVAAALREVGIGSPAALLATWITDRAGLVRYAGDAQPVSDDRPRIEYATWVRPRELPRVLPQLLALQTRAPLVNENATVSAAVATEHARLMMFYAAGLHAYDGNRGAWAAEMKRVMTGDGENPYYRWFGSADT